MNELISLNNISAAYGNKVVLTNVNLKIYDKDFLGLIGPNGGGKSTLVKIILGLKDPIAGEVHYYDNGKEVQEITMGYLPQYNSIDKQFPISVYEVILSGLSKEKPLIHKYSQKQHDKVREVIDRMGLEGLENRAIGELSGGQLQRALLGRALVSDPKVLILDEPNTYIDKRFEAKLYSLLEEINKERAIILVSHDIGTVLQNVKSIACVNEEVDYHPDSEVSVDWLEEHFGCPIELLGHGTFPHRILKSHHEHEHEHENEKSDN